MIPSNLKQSSLPLKKRNQDQSHLPTTTPTTDTSHPLPVFLDNVEDQGANCAGEHRGHHYLQQQQQEKPNEFLLIDGSSYFRPSFSTNSHDDNDKTDHGYPGSVKWTSSKMRWMRKMMGSEQTVMSKPRRSLENLREGKQQNQDNSSSSSNFTSGTIRVCSDCSTTKTPLWRSGPQGPKSLCNACGIRRRKARRALAAAAAAAGGGLLATDTPRKVKKGKRTGRDGPIPNKKRCKNTTTRTAQKKFQIDDIMISLSDDTAFHRVFPQDEKDAAILLMALSCGNIHG